MNRSSVIKNVKIFLYNCNAAGNGVFAEVS